MNIVVLTTVACVASASDTTTNQIAIQVEEGVKWRLIWKYNGGSGPISVWRPELSGYCSLGDVAVKTIGSLPTGTSASMVKKSIGVHPTDFEWKAPRTRLEV